MSYIVHPRIVPDKVEERRYQMSMINGCLRSNTLLILPTGLGKTVVALYVSAERLSIGKTLILAPTKPLLDQHQHTFENLMLNPKVCVLNGNINPEKRALMIEQNEVIIATPQTIANDLEEGRYDLDGFSLVIYDEAHRGVGDYAYVTVAQFCHSGIRSVGMTASPGAKMNRIKEVCINLDLRRIDARSESDPDVSPYVHDTMVKRIEVNLPADLVVIRAHLKEEMNHYVSELTGLNLMDSNWPASKTHLLSVQNNLMMRLKSGEKTAIVYRGLAADAICLKLSHAIELSETQGVTPLRAYVSKLDAEAAQDNKGRSAREMTSRPEFIEMRRVLDATNVEHPKISRVMSLVSQILGEHPDSRIMIFSHYRETCDLLVEKLSQIEAAHVGRLVGQSGDGLKQKEQIELLDKLRSGEINVIVSTSVGEEGLDISSTNAVIFYEPIPSEIRTIQRRGRTGRKNDGDVYLLIAKDTMDEVAERTSERKEEIMRSNIEKLNRELSSGHGFMPDYSQRKLDRF